MSFQDNNEDINRCTIVFREH